MYFSVHMVIRFHFLSVLSCINVTESRKRGLHFRLLSYFFLRRSRLSRRKIIVVIYVCVKGSKRQSVILLSRVSYILIIKLHKKTFEKSSFVVNAAGVQRDSTVSLNLFFIFIIFFYCLNKIDVYFLKRLKIYVHRHASNKKLSSTLEDKSLRTNRKNLEAHTD